MTLKDRKTLLAFLADEVGYTGAKTLADIQKFWDDESNGIEIVDQNGDKITGKDLKTFWERTPKVTIETEDEEGDEPKKKSSLAGKISKANAEIDAKAKRDDGLAWSPAAARRKAARKAYDRKAQHEAAGARRAKAGGITFADAEEAESFGAWFRCSTLGSKGLDWEDKAHDLDICRKANTTIVNSSGGATIPDDFAPTLINLKEIYGVARSVTGTTPMSRDTLTVPRRTGGVTVYAPGEASSITESNPAFDNVNLTARKIAAYTEVSSELLNDSAINIGNLIADEMAYAFAEKEDQMFFNGDGTSTYFHTTGVRSALTSLSATIANIAGLVVGTGNAYSELTIADFQKVIGRAPSYIDTRSPYWICHKRFYHEVMRALAVAKNGTTATEVVNGVPMMIFEGYPVRFAQVMPRVEGNSQVCALFGAFSEGAKIGEVTGSMTIATSEHFKFQSDVMSFRATERVAITVQDVGNANATEASRVPGPIVGLITAAS